MNYSNKFGSSPSAPHAEAIEELDNMKKIIEDSKFSNKIAFEKRFKLLDLINYATKANNISKIDKESLDTLIDLYKLTKNKHFKKGFKYLLEKFAKKGPSSNIIFELNGTGDYLTILITKKNIKDIFKKACKFKILGFVTKIEWN